MDEASRYVWIFPQKSKEPPTNLVSHFLHMCGQPSGGMIRCDQGGELACSEAFCSTMLALHLFTVKLTGADTKKWNDTLAVTVRALLYGAALPAKYWSAALLHVAYLHNWRVHQRLMSSPYEHLFGRKPDLKNLNCFGITGLHHTIGPPASSLVLPLPTPTFGTLTSCLALLRPAIMQCLMNAGSTT